MHQNIESKSYISNHYNEEVIYQNVKLQKLYITSFKKRNVHIKSVKSESKSYVLEYWKTKDMYKIIKKQIIYQNYKTKVIYHIVQKLKLYIKSFKRRSYISNC